MGCRTGDPTPPLSRISHPISHISYRGRLITNSAPPLDPLPATIDPEWVSTILRAIARPSPVPAGARARGLLAGEERGEKGGRSPAAPPGAGCPATRGTFSGGAGGRAF